MSGAHDCTTLRFQEDQIVPLKSASLSPSCKKFLDYWRTCGRDRGCAIPRRRDIDPLAMVSLLPGIALLDVVGVEPSLDFRVRVLGTRLVQITGELTGKLISQTPFGQRSVNVLRQVVTERQCVYTEGTLCVLERDRLAFAELCLPLTNDRGSIDKVLVYFDVPSRCV